LSSGHHVIDITNGHFIHASPLEGIGVSIYLVPITCLILPSCYYNMWPCCWYLQLHIHGSDQESFSTGHYSQITFVIGVIRGQSEDFSSFYAVTHAFHIVSMSCVFLQMLQSKYSFSVCILGYSSNPIMWMTACSIHIEVHDKGWAHYKDSNPNIYRSVSGDPTKTFNHFWLPSE
jgi:hypothetical protein